MINTLIEFLKKKPGYLKKSPEQLLLRFNKIGIDVEYEDCKLALAEARLLKKEKNKKQIDDVIIKTAPEGFVIKSKWQSASGEWLMSLKPEVSEEEDNVVNYSEIFSEIVKSEISTKDIPPVTSSNNLDLKVWMSDKHIGSIGSQDNIYNAKEFSKRMNKVLYHIYDLVSNYGAFKTITIADLGDALDGMDSLTVSRTHKLKQNMNNIEAFEVYFREHKIFFDNLFNSGAAEKYQMWEVTNANHDGDFGYVCKRALMAYVEGVYPDVSVVNFPDFIGSIEHEDIHYVLSHGKDKENRFKGFPLFPNPQTESFIEAFLKRKSIPRNARIRMIKGDLHQYCIAPCKNIECYKTVPSMMGTTDWILTNFEMTNAGTAYEILNLDTGIISESIINL